MVDCGVYRITCSMTGRVYIGSSLSIRKRFGEHKGALRNGKHHSLLLQRAWNKYGEAAFEFEPLLYCSPDMRFFYEQLLIDGYGAANPRTGMNRDPVAKCKPPIGSFRGHRHSAESRALMSARLKGRAAWNKGIPSPAKGRPRTEADRAKIAAAKRAGANASISMDVARRMRAARASGSRARQIAADFGASLNVVYRVLRGISWAESA